MEGVLYCFLHFSYEYAQYRVPMRTSAAPTGPTNQNMEIPNPITLQPTSSDNVSSLATSLPASAEVSRTVIVGDLFSAVRYGQLTLARNLLQDNGSLVNSYGKCIILACNTCPNCFFQLDPQGYTCAHWAAKRGDIDMLKLLREFDGDLGLPTHEDSKMLPIHWAASEGKIDSIKFIIEAAPRSSHGALSINAQDSNGYTPVIVATQYNHPKCVLYLYFCGCDMHLVDSNGDDALHWAAYKGYVELVGLLTYLMPMSVEMIDNFGQVLQTTF